MVLIYRTHMGEYFRNYKTFLMEDPDLKSPTKSISDNIHCMKLGLF